MKNSTSSGRYWLAADVVFVPVDDGSARLLNMSGSFYALSSSGAEMLRGVLDAGVRATVREIVGRYDVDPARVQSDLSDLLRKLRRARLVRTGELSSWTLRLRAGLARLAVGLVFETIPLHTAPTALMVFARMCFALFGWAHTASAWSRSAGRGAVHGDANDLTERLDRLDATIRNVAARLPSVECKERALCTWFLLGRQGIPATLVVGIDLFPLAGHCWCEVGSRVLTDFEDRCEAYLPVARYELGATHVGENLAGAGEPAHQASG